MTVDTGPWSDVSFASCAEAANVFGMRAAEATEIMATLRHFAALLADSEHELNAINVFPVADRDTGTNMCRTIEAMIAELEAVGDGAEVASAVALAALNGARGNSGLIAAQFLAGMFSVEPASLFVDAGSLARALAAGAIRARAAVANPVDGTMVSVVDVAARAAAERTDDTPLELLGAVHRIVQRAVEDTVGQLPVLAEAGVLDAGAAGMSLFFDAMLVVAGGEPAEATDLTPLDAADPSSADPLLVDPLSVEPSSAGPSSPEPVAAGSPDVLASADIAWADADTSAVDAVPAAVVAGEAAVAEAPADDGGPPGFAGFELQFTADGTDEVADALRRLLVAVGTDVVVSQAGGVLRAHVHTAMVGPTIEAVLDHVRPRNISVEALWVPETAPAPVGSGQPPGDADST